MGFEPESTSLIRQLVSILLICSVLTSHLAVAVPHSHAGMSPAERAVHDLVPHVHVGHHSHQHHDHHGNHCHVGHSQIAHREFGYDRPEDAHDRGTNHKHQNVDQLGDLHSQPGDELPCETVPDRGSHGVPVYLAFAVFGTSQPSFSASILTETLPSWTLQAGWSERAARDWRLGLILVHDRPPERLRYGISTYLLTRRLRL